MVFLQGTAEVLRRLGSLSVSEPAPVVGSLLKAPGDLLFLGDVAWDDG